MPLPTTYTEATLADYIVTVLSNVGVALAWTSATPEVADAVTDTIYAYGPTDTTVNPPLYVIANMTDMQKLRAFARREAWKQAVNATAAGYDVSSAGETLRRSQLNQQAERRYNAAYSEALAYDSYADTIQPAALVAGTKPYASETLGVGSEIG